jgi:hypothetical protein
VGAWQTSERRPLLSENDHLAGLAAPLIYGDGGPGRQHTGRPVRVRLRILLASHATEDEGRLPAGLHPEDDVAEARPERSGYWVLDFATREGHWGSPPTSGALRASVGSTEAAKDVVARFGRIDRRIFQYMH